MRDQRIPGSEPEDPYTLKHALLDLLLEDRPVIWTTTELDRCLIPSSHAEPSAVDVEDAIEDLYAAGLIHRSGQFVFATRTAHQAHTLAS